MASAIIQRPDGRILLLQRSLKSTFLKGYWQPPEGKLETGEGPLTALLREVAEEIHYIAEVARLVRILSTAQCVAGVNFDVTRYVYWVEAHEPFFLSREHRAAGWFSVPEIIKHPLLVPGVADICNI